MAGGIVENFLKSTVDEGFHCQNVCNKFDGKEDEFDQSIEQLLSTLSENEALENFLSQYLASIASNKNKSKQKFLFKKLRQLVNDNKVPARSVCEQILVCEGLKLENRCFWVEAFNTIKNILPNVDYKGVREVMKGCREKTSLFPVNLDPTLFLLMEVLVDLMEYIFDRNACLLPAYFIINELQKSESSSCHWMIQNLITRYVEEFIPMTQMLTIIGYSEKLPVVEYFSSEQATNQWRLEPTTLRFSLKGALPYNPSLLQSQTKLLRYVLEQPYSRDFVCNMLSLSKNQRQSNMQLEQNLIWLIISAMEKTENSPNSVEDTIPQHWLHLSSQLIYFVLFQFATFANIVASLSTALAAKDIRRGRDHLMWVLLQFISGSIQRNPLQNFLPVLKLFDILYPEKEPLPIPNIHHPSCTVQMAATCIWIHLMRRAQSEAFNVNRSVPPALRQHFEFLQQLAVPTSNSNLNLSKDYSVSLLCNAYSTNQDFFSRPMAVLIDNIKGSSVNSALSLPSTPLSMNLLDSLTVHSKMSLIHSMVTHMIKQAQTKPASTNITAMSSIAPALVETYSRLLVYTEIESLGIKGFLTQLLPAVFKCQSWNTLHTLLEMIAWKTLQNIQPHYRIQLLTHLNSILSQPPSDRVQLHLCIESTAIKLISGIGSMECRLLSESKGTLVSSDSEEINRLLVLTISRALHITNAGTDASGASWSKELLQQITQNTPHSWSSYTLQCFPNVVKNAFSSQTPVKENKAQLKKQVEDEYMNWMSTLNEAETMAHFASPSPSGSLVLCLAVKTLLEGKNLTPTMFKIIQRNGAKLLLASLRKMCDYVVSLCNINNAIVNKCVEVINAMIWNHHVFTIDRFVLCMVLRNHEGNEIQICFVVIQIMLMKANDFKNRIQDFVKENSPDHWKQSNWYEKHTSFHQKYPEYFYPDENSTQLPVYFGNVCLRFLPVLDIVLHRVIEAISVGVNISKTFDYLLDNLGCLYKFHDRPITFLFNTLHYYEGILRERPFLKKKLLSGILGSLYEVYPQNWAVSDVFRMYLAKKEDEEDLWSPDLQYYVGLIRRFVETIDGKLTFGLIDWRFNEFPNCPTHALYVTCVELLCLPIAPKTVASSLIEVITKGHLMATQNHMQSWINGVGLIFSRLPESFWGVIFDKIHEVLVSPTFVEWNYNVSPFTLFNYDVCSKSILGSSAVYLLATAHSIFHHFNVGQVGVITECVNQTLKPIIKTEAQLIYLCHLLGPFLQRLETEIPRAVMDLTVILYDVLEQVDRCNPNVPLKYVDPVCDLLYHLKYQYVGDSMKTNVEAIIKRLRQPLRMKLRFITRLQVDEV